MIKLKIINKSYGELNIFKNTNISIEDGEFVVIKGLSGSGKTTLINMLGLLDYDYEGEYKLNNIMMNRNNTKKHRQLFSYMFQEPLLIPYLNVIENITMPLLNKGIKINMDAIDKLMLDLNIFDKKFTDVNTLSEGEKTRVSLSRAIASEARILMIDEPTANLDPVNAKGVMESIKKAQLEYNLTICMVTHSDEFDNYFDRIILINNGKLHEKN